MTATQAPTPGPLSASDVKLLVKGDLLRVVSDEVMPIGSIVTFTELDFDATELRFAEGDGLSWMIDRFAFIGRPDADGWMSWSGGENPAPGRRVEVKIRWRNGVASEWPVESDVMRWKHRRGRDGGGDIIAFRLAPTAPVEASGSEREVPWLTDDECDEVGKLRFALAMKVYRMSSDLRQNLRPQPSGETRADESLDDVARRLFAAQYPGRDYDDLKDMVQIGWLRKAHDEILSARANPSPTPAADADRGMKAFNFINDLYRIKAEFPAIRLHGALKKAEALAALKSTAAKEGGE